METKITSFKKGLSLEDSFSNYMKLSLGFDEVKNRSHVSSKSNAKGSEVDIIGIKKDRRGKIFYNLSLILIMIGGILLVYGSIVNDLQIIYVALIPFVSSIIYALIGKNLFDKYTWVECKAWEKNVPLKEVRDSLSKLNEHNESKDKKHIMHRMIFVAQNGFVENVKEFAKEKEIELYIQSGESFQKIKL